MANQSLSVKYPNYINSIISVAMVLFLLGVFGLSFIYGHQISKIIKENIVISVEIKDSTSQNDIEKLKNFISSKPYSLSKSIRFVPKSEGLKELETVLGDELALMEMENPLFDLVEFKVKDRYGDKENLVSIKNDLENQENVANVNYPIHVLNNIFENIKNIRLFAILFSILLVIVAIMLIHNTVRLALYANRFLIKNMELVGATWGFISRPFLIRSIYNGIWSSLLAIGGLIGLTFLAEKDIPELKQLSDEKNMINLFVLILVLGLVLSGVSTWLVIRKYLKMKIDELY